MTENKNNRRPLEWWEIRRLESQGCRSENWSGVSVCESTDLGSIRNIRFGGSVSIGSLGRDCGSELSNACLIDCILGDHVEIRNIGIHIRNCKIGERSRILNTALVEFEAETMCGIGTEVDVLDETGSRFVKIYPGLSAQAALLMAREPRWRERHIDPILEDHICTNCIYSEIGDKVVVENCGSLINVYIGNEISVKGATYLSNGSLINNAGPGRCLAHIGAGVNAENFIVEDGVLDSGAIVRNCYIGQGACLEKGFTAHDSLIFANCSLENGEACAVFAGPYTVSMHKSTLLIGCQTSFMNAGSGTNQSNHMYKLGPVHWGILERGVKTASASYLMLGAKIGAFSMLMGQHKTHPDSSQFPFSYLFGDDKGATVVVPGVMLRSCGLLRDEQKWPNRDRRVKRKLPLHDKIVFDVLNPLTVDKMLSASDVIEKLLSRPADDDFYIRYRGMRFTRAALERARHLYELAIYKYLSRNIDEIQWPETLEDVTVAEWVDIAGLPMTRDYLERAMEAESISEMETVFEQAYSDYRELEKKWIMHRFAQRWHRTKEVIYDYAAEFDRMIDEDRTRYIEDLEAQNQMLSL